MNREGRFNETSAGDWIYGVNPVLEALFAGRDIKGIYISSSRNERVSQILKEAEKRRIPVNTRASGFFDTNFPKGHQGIAARVLQKQPEGLADLLNIPSNKKETPLFIILDGIEDPRNFGAILRSAEAAGVHGVVIQSHRAAKLGPEVSKASAGAIEYVPVSVVPNIKHAIRAMKELGIMIIGAEAGDHPAIWHIDLTIPLAVVIGSEGQGLRMTVKEACDKKVSLPMRGKINSVNASVAAGIFLFEILRQRFVKIPAVG